MNFGEICCTNVSSLGKACTHARSCIICFLRYIWKGLLPNPSTYLGYDRKGGFKNRKRICRNTFLVLITRTGIYFRTFRFRSISNRNFRSFFRFWLTWNRKLDLTGIAAGNTEIIFPNICCIQKVFNQVRYTFSTIT